jgi:translation initiation factor 2 gamma subunit (eIF-2gamma)
VELVLKKRLGCLHAHFSNIEYIEKALSPYDIECIHFVDPGLMYQVISDENFKVSDAQKKVKDQIEWIARCNVDAILITCTNYIAILQDEELSISVPIIKIDEPYFECICKTQQPQTILFTNAATVNGTIERLKQFASDHKKAIDIEVIVMNNTFDLIMKGLKEEYNQEIIKFLQTMINENKILSVAQLSMVDASKEVQQMTSKPIINPLDTLISYILNQLKIDTPFN